MREAGPGGVIGRGELLAAVAGAAGPGTGCDEAESRRDGSAEESRAVREPIQTSDRIGPLGGTSGRETAAGTGTAEHARPCGTCTRGIQRYREPRRVDVGRHQSRRDV